MGNDIEKLNIFDKQLDNLSKSINTLPRLFKSFTSQKRTENIKKTIVKKKAVERIKKAFKPKIEKIKENIVKTKAVERIKKAFKPKIEKLKSKQQPPKIVKRKFGLIQIIKHVIN